MHFVLFLPAESIIGLRTVNSCANSFRSVLNFELKLFTVHDSPRVSL